MTLTRLALAAACAASPAAALELEIPVRCELGRYCYIQSYVDRDPGPGSTDFTCGALSYDGHKGTDFRLQTFADLTRNIAVLAAAPGHVRAVRDGEPDTGRDAFTPGRDCGNAVVIDHGEGWETQYCHLARSSVEVQVGQIVEAGTRLGLIGYSGNTEFPHLHLSVRQDGIPIDPFDARSIAESCSLADTEALWSAAALEELTYQPGGIVDAGFAPGAVDLEVIRTGKTADFKPDSPAFVFWARFYGLSAADTVAIRLLRPSGEVLVESDTVMPRNRAEHMLFAGRKRPESGWPPGTYQAIAEIIRGNQRVHQVIREITLP
ncbi:MAG: M23 family metallopeptidase [Pseudomonadota bacterium]